MLSLECVCYIYSISSGVRYVPSRTRPYDGVWRYHRLDGHEHITSCLFYINMINFSVGGPETKGCARHVSREFIWMKI